MGALARLTERLDALDARVAALEVNLPTPAPGSDQGPAAKDVRAWAKAEGIEVPARGPLPDEVVELYLNRDA